MPVHAREVSGKGAVLGVESMETIDAGGYGITHVAAETTCALTASECHCHIHLVFENAKLLQKSEMWKDIVIELSYRGFSRISDYS